MVPRLIAAAEILRHGQGTTLEEVVMIAHEDGGPDPAARALTAFAKGFQKEFFISPIGRSEDSVAPIASGHDGV